MAPERPMPDNNTQYVKDVEAKFKIQVIFSARPKLHSSLVLVKGCEKEAASVQEAAQLLINFMCESIAVRITFSSEEFVDISYLYTFQNQILVNLKLEISPQHHEIVKGKNNSQLLSIMDQTKTKVCYRFV